MEKLRTREISNFEDAKNFLFYELSSSEKKLYGREKGIERTKYFMNLLGNPQDTIKTIHIAGTSGKGSTAYILDSLLRAAGKTIGLSVSPHVYDVRERMQINGCYVNEGEFVATINSIMPAIVEMDKSLFGRPTYYEACLALAFTVFNNNNPDYVVLETGIGGLFDSTNVINRSDKLAVITKLGLDHTEVLGSTIGEIAAQKAGIIAAGGEVIAVEPSEKEAKIAIESAAMSKTSKLSYVDSSRLINIANTGGGLNFTLSLSQEKKVNVSLPLFGEYQAQNALTAITALETLSKRDGFDLQAKDYQRGMSEVLIPARTEIRRVHDRMIIIDSAHNPQKMEAFFGLISEAKFTEKPVVIFGAKKGKDFSAELKIIKQNANSIVISGFFKDQPNVVYSCEEPREIAAEAEKAGLTVLGYFNEPEAAVKHTLNNTKPSQPIIIVGSMYMIGEMNTMLIAH